MYRIKRRHFVSRASWMVSSALGRLIWGNVRVGGYQRNLNELVFELSNVLDGG